MATATNPLVQALARVARPAGMTTPVSTTANTAARVARPADFGAYWNDWYGGTPAGYQVNVVNGVPSYRPIPNGTIAPIPSGQSSPYTAGSAPGTPANPSVPAPPTRGATSATPATPATPAPGVPATPAPPAETVQGNPLSGQPSWAANGVHALWDPAAIVNGSFNQNAFLNWYNQRFGGAASQTLTAQ